jgi:hypothetical protein
MSVLALSTSESQMNFTTAPNGDLEKTPYICKKTYGLFENKIDCE